MEISPIDYRYGREQVKSIFSQEVRLKFMLQVELAVLEARTEFGLIPKEIPDKLSRLIESNVIKYGEIAKEELKTRHDITAMINVTNAHSKGLGEYLHAGLTSNDVNDTATGLQLKTFSIQFLQSMQTLIETLSKLVSRYKETPMLGRTHGQHASPITFGLKLSVFLAEFLRHCDRYLEATPRFLVGKIRGPVGTGAGLGPRALDLEEQALTILGLNAEENSTQVVSRDRYIELLSILINMCATAERLATEIRNLQRPEIYEVSEGFEKKNQVGSSSMPSKRNPITCENITSLSRLVRSFLNPEIEASVLWHERDLANSALERFTIPYTCILSDYIVFETTNVLSTLYVNEERMLSNLRGDPLAMSESLVIAINANGVPRDEAHEIVRRASMNSSSVDSYIDLIVKATKNRVSLSVLQDALNPLNFLGKSSEICKSAILRSNLMLKKIKKRRGDLLS